MIFGATPLEEAEGAILAHSVRLPDRLPPPLKGRVIRKGTVLDAQAIAALRAAGHDPVIAARLAPGEVAEDEAASRLADAMLRPLVARSRAATGRVNLVAQSGGLLVLDVALLDRLNSLDESLTIATLPNFSVVGPNEMLATIKVIPFAVPGAALGAAQAMLREGAALALHPFRPLRVGLVMSELPGAKQSAMEGAVEVTRARVEALGGTLLPVERVRHEVAPMADALARLRRQGAELLLIAGASAVADRRDIAPAAIVAAGGRIEHFGMPVDPGNLLCLGAVGDIAAIVLPGCARSPRLNGFDWVLARLFASVPVRARDVMAMGVGGLLKEIETRPLPREKAPAAPAPAPAPAPGPVAALVLAAGRSRRMAPLNKLLVADARGTPMIARVVDEVVASGLRPVLVVTGHERERVAQALAGRPVTFAHAEDHAQGLSASLRAGIAALPEDAPGVLVCLGDMPLVSAAVMRQLVAAFDPQAERAIVQPSFGGQRGNPVLWGRGFFAALMQLGGDAGARQLLARHADHLVEVEVDEDGVLRDFDTTEELRSAPGFGRAG